MAFATWWRGDHLPTFTQIEEFSASPTDDTALLARLAHLELSEVQRRMNEGHHPYVAWLDDQPVAYGWVATQTAHIGELDLTIVLPEGECYLWDFATLRAWRGRGVYPRLLQAILATESQVAERFWIIAAPENRASSTGIAKAGFTSIAHLSFQRAGQPGLIPMDQESANKRMAVAAALLQLPVLDVSPHQALSPCWHCAIDARQAGRSLTDVSCWPELSATELAVTNCHCG